MVDLERKEFERDVFYAVKLYVLMPSKIISVDGEKVGNMVYQNVTFERQSTPALAYLDWNIYKDVFMMQGLRANRTFPKCYYDERYLSENGAVDNVINGNKWNEFINVFDGDATLLSDFMFASSLQHQGLVSRFKYFKHPFRMDNRDLKKALSEELLEDKSRYTLDELKEIHEELLKMEVSPKIRQRRYRVAQRPRQKLFGYGSFFEAGPRYACVSGYSDSFSTIEVLEKEVKRARRGSL